MKCFEVTKCPDEVRSACYVWNCFKENPADMENLKCWVIKGVYQEGNRDHLEKCHACEYYKAQNGERGVQSQFDANVATITCEGVINNDRSRAIERVWADLKARGKTRVVLNITNVNNIYSCGLGVIITVHKEAKLAGGMLVVVGMQGYVKLMFESTKLHRLLHTARDLREAADLFDAVAKKEAAKAATPVAVAAAVVEKPKVHKKRISCWEYWRNHNPRNATKCDECFRKINPTTQPCWIVEGMIEGVSFQYINEECEGCEYYNEFNESN